MREEKLDFWVKNRQNVLFIGKHGVGKTAIIKETFERNKLKWLYFSASTMDPWVDFIGVPRESSKLPEQFNIIKTLADIDQNMAIEWVDKNWHLDASAAKRILQSLEKPNPVYLDLVRPQAFANDEVEALFFDEYNRSPKKVRNAVMELIQFKSINGKKFNNLKLIWAAINPEDDESNGINLGYDVERLDPAQQDRFQIQVEIPFKPNGDWFKAKYGDHMAKIAIEWWEGLNEEERNKISPRRLDAALNLKVNKGDMRDVLPVSANVSKLNTALNTGHMPDKLANLKQAGDVVAARTFLSNENNYSAAIKYIAASDALMGFFLPLLAKEKLGVLMSDNEECCDHIINNSDKIPLFQDVCKNIIAANQNTRLVKKIRKALTENQDLANAFHNNPQTAPEKAFFVKNPATRYSTVLGNIKSNNINTAGQRLSIYNQIEKSIPEIMTADEALLTLELLSRTVEKAWASTMTSEPMANFMGIVNHCIAEIARNTGYNAETILSRHGNRFRTLMEKIKEFGLAAKLYAPK